MVERGRPNRENTVIVINKLDNGRGRRYVVSFGKIAVTKSHGPEIFCVYEEEAG